MPPPPPPPLADIFKVQTHGEAGCFQVILSRELSPFYQQTSSPKCFFFFFFPLLHFLFHVTVTWGRGSTSHLSAEITQHISCSNCGMTQCLGISVPRWLRIYWAGMWVTGMVFTSSPQVQKRKRLKWFPQLGHFPRQKTNKRNSSVFSCRLQCPLSTSPPVLPPTPKNSFQPWWIYRAQTSLDFSLSSSAISQHPPWVNHAITLISVKMKLWLNRLLLGGREPPPVFLGECKEGRRALSPVCQAAWGVRLQFASEPVHFVWPIYEWSLCKISSISVPLNQAALLQRQRNYTATSNTLAQWRLEGLMNKNYPEHKQESILTFHLLCLMFAYMALST